MVDIFNPIAIQFVADDDEPVEKDIVQKSFFLDAAYKLDLDRIVGEIAPDATKDPSLSVFSDVPPDAGSYVFELATVLPYYLPRLANKPEYILNIEGRELFVCLRMVRCFSGEGLPAADSLSYHLVHRRALSQIVEKSPGKLHPIPLKTFVSRTFECKASSVESAIRENFKEWRDSLITDVARVVDVMRVAKEAGSEVLLPQLALTSFPIFWLIVKGGNQKAGCLQISGDLASAAFRSMFNFSHETTAKLEHELFSGEMVSTHEEALVLARTFAHYGHLSLAIVQICVACESVLFQAYTGYLVSKGVSKTKIEGNKKDLTFSQLLNLHLFAMVDVTKLSNSASLIGQINWARNIRNDAVHGGRVHGRVTAKQVREAIAAAQQLIVFIINGTPSIQPISQGLSGMTGEKSLRAERIEEKFWLADLATYRKLETWGTSLFFAAIGVLTKQLLEWTRSADPGKIVDVPSISSIAPAVLGLVGFVYLRVVNSRVRGAQQKVHELGGIAQPSPRRAGWLGWVLATIPLGAGYSGAAAIAHGNTQQVRYVEFFGFLALLAVFWAILYQFGLLPRFVWFRRLRDFVLVTCCRRKGVP